MRIGVRCLRIAKYEYAEFGFHGQNVLIVAKVISHFVTSKIIPRLARLYPTKHSASPGLPSRYRLAATHKYIAVTIQIRFADMLSFVHFFDTFMGYVKAGST